MFEQPDTGVTTDRPTTGDQNNKAVAVAFLSRFMDKAIAERVVGKVGNADIIAADVVNLRKRLTEEFKGVRIAEGVFTKWLVRYLYTRFGVSPPPEPQPNEPQPKDDDDEEDGDDEYDMFGALGNYLNKKLKGDGLKRRGKDRAVPTNRLRTILEGEIAAGNDNPVHARQLRALNRRGRHF